MSYKPVPEGAIKLRLHRQCCRDTCGCNFFQIMAVLPTDHPMTPHYYKNDRDEWSIGLWESEWFWPGECPDQTDYAALKKGVEDACRHYNIPFEPGDAPFWEWKTEVELRKSVDKGSHVLAHRIDLASAATEAFKEKQAQALKASEIFANNAASSAPYVDAAVDGLKKLSEADKPAPAPAPFLQNAK